MISEIQWGARLGMVVLRAIVWGMAGGLFGALCAGLIGVFKQLGLDAYAVFAAILASGTVTAGFYGAMRVALVGTGVAVLTTIANLVVTGSQPRMLPLLVLAALGGLIGGALFSLSARIPPRPLGFMLSGIIAGTFGGAMVGLWNSQMGELGMAMTAGIGAALVGSLSVFLARWIVPHCGRWVPSIVSATLVASLIATVVAGSMWLLGSVTAGFVDPTVAQSIERILAPVPYGLLGGAMGGALAGVVLELLRVEWAISWL